MGPINKAVPSFSDSLTEYVKGGGRHSEHFSVLKIVFTTLMVRARISGGDGGVSPTGFLCPPYCLCSLHPHGGQKMSLALLVHMSC